jgi:hypothetical protein
MTTKANRSRASDLRSLNAAPKGLQKGSMDLEAGFSQRIPANLYPLVGTRIVVLELSRSDGIIYARGGSSV